MREMVLVGLRPSASTNPKHHIPTSTSGSTAVSTPKAVTLQRPKMNATATMMPTMLPAVSRKRKIILDSFPEHKRHRTWTELEYEMMLEEATLLCEELELLLAVAADLCRDLTCDPSQVQHFTATLRQIEEHLVSTDDLTERQVRVMCQQMIAMMQYLCQRHYDHFGLIEMQDQLRECRDRFMRFICQYAAMVGLYQ
ncbi:hypothetical protein Poli38472_005623 [Pythium oligandrum]|uniref:Uncharacterized protein n=1 Tax=Pythium oligandrum TaxID=41045 RepID=A0A8K1CHV4_PYTOL|nr:hypothetical protein Poli38472_005623 [Pythium oligandrum]|eukprot:TMW63005.1 hypothetical protein Poli38472_005623 [Pythium oligandrum]